MIKIASLFSGIGGFEKGLLQAIPEANIVFSSEIDKYARQIYKQNYGVEPHGDITKIKASNIPDHDILCGGFPCQAFSIAGKRRGFEDTRGTLFFEIVRIAKVKRPKLLFLENVRGLLSHDQGRTFQTILRSMDDLGYDAEWQVFNSKNHGVPQNRERVFLIGHLRGAGTRPIFPITESNGLPNEEEPTVYCLDANYHKGVAQQSRSVIALTEARTDEAKKIRREIKYKDFSPRRGKELVPRTDGLMNCVTSGQSKEGLIQISPCIRAEHHNTADVHFINESNKIRRLMPIECERLQGFPDNWTEGISDTQRYKCIGNAVTVNVIEFISLHIKEMLLNKDA